MLDQYLISELFTEQELQSQAMARAFLDAEVMPNIGDWWDQEIWPDHLVRRFGEIGFFGVNLPTEYGGGGASEIVYGLFMYELERADSGLRSLASVQNSLVMYPIHRYGSVEQKQHYLPGLAAGQLVGCFGLTEHEGGSDPMAMQARLRYEGDVCVLNGTKMWISNGNIADLAIVWAKDDEDIVRGVIVPTDAPGFTANKIKKKASMRASVTSELVLEDVRLARSYILPEAEGLRAPLSCLTQARYGIAWGALGALEAVYTEALAFARERITFGKPIASRQLVQAKLVDMVADHTKGLLLAWQL